MASGSMCMASGSMCMEGLANNVRAARVHWTNKEAQ
jgi:hypothetical protein